MSSLNAADQAWRITAPNVLTLDQPSTAPLPTPAPGESLIRIQAASINYRDILIATHAQAYPILAAPGLVPLSDAAGIVQSSTSPSALAPGTRVLIAQNSWTHGGVSNFKIDEVLGGGDVHGTLRRWMIVRTDKLIVVLAHLSLEEAAALPTAGSTAWNMLRTGQRLLRLLDDDGEERGNWKKLEGSRGRSFVTQGTGGVSLFALQFAVAAGAEVCATSSSENKIDLLKRLGAKWTVDYRKKPEWAKEVLAMTGGKGVDHVLDVGGAGTIEQSLAATRYGGLITVVGVLTESSESDLIPAILYGAKTVRGSLGAGSFEMLKEMMEFINQHKIQPIISKVFDFENAPEAFEYAKGQTGTGKVVIRC